MSVWENGGEGTGGGGVMRVLETLIRFQDGMPATPLKVAAIGRYPQMRQESAARSPGALFPAREKNHDLCP